MADGAAVTPLPVGEGAILDVLLARIDAAVCLYDAEDRVVLWNPAYLRFFPEEAGLLRVGVSYEETLRRYFSVNLGPEELASGERHVAAGLRRHRDPSGPYVYQRRDGRWFRVESHRFADGGLLKIWTDVSAEKALVADRALGRDTAAAMRVGFARIDADGRFQMANRALGDLLPDAVDLFRPGVPYATLLAAVGERLLAPGEEARLHPLLARGDAATALVTAPLTLHRRDGGWLRFEERAGEDGDLYSLWTDVTAQVRADEAARRAQRQLSVAVESLPEGFALFDDDDRLVECNALYRGLMGPGCVTGATYEEILETGAAAGHFPAASALEAAERQRWRETMRVAHRFPGGPFDLPVAGGRVVRIAERPTPDGGIVSVVRDVTGERQREGERAARSAAEIAVKNAVLEATLENMGQGIAMVDADLRVLAVNRRLFALYDLPPDLARPGMRFDELIRATARQGEYGEGVDIEEVVRERVAFARSTDTPVYEHVRPNGLIIEVRTIRLPDGGFVRTYTDMTRRKATEEELARKSALLQAVLESIGQGLCAFDGDLRMIAWNKRFIDLLQFPVEFNLEGRPFADFMRYNAERGEYGPGDIEEQVRSRVERARTPTPHRFERKLGDGTVIEVYGLPMEGGGFVSTFTDVSERKRVEEELRAAKERAERALAELQLAQESLVQAEKLASLAQLVAGVAHEINTPVGVALTAISHLGEEVGKIAAAFHDNRLRRSDFAAFLALSSETAHMIMTNIDRASDLIQSFKQVAVDQASAERRIFNLRSYVHEVLLSLRPRFKKTRVTVKTDIPPGIVIDGYPGALSQILSNLLINALVHAYDEGQAGTIRLAASELPAGMVEIRYTDDGCGIAPEHLARIFDPFFTTKRGQGASGLGLNIVYNIVTGTLRGTIAVSSEVGAGTAFTLRFPAQAPHPDP